MTNALRIALTAAVGLIVAAVTASAQQAAAYARVRALTDPLAYARDEAARKYLNRQFESRGGTATQPAERCDELVRLLASPGLPSGLRPPVAPRG